VADEVEDGPPWGFIGLMAAIVVGALAFVLLVRATSTDPAQLPALGGKGLAWARTEVTNAGFESISAHDAWGRDRSGGDDQDWRVCFQSPPPGAHPKTAAISLGVVPLDQSCPTTQQGGDLGVRKAVVDGDRMPVVVGKTPFMVRRDFGDKASLRFVDRAGSRPGQPHLITEDLGDWQICTQSVAPGVRFAGQPVEMQVVAYGRPC
jgi:hypothetical protein